MAYKECVFNVFMVNEHYSQEHADAQHGGEDSPDNRRYDWEDEFAITSSVDRVERFEQSTFPLQGELPDGTPFRHEVGNMLLFGVFSRDADPVYVGASESMIHHVEEEVSDDVYRIRIFLKDYEPLSNPIPGIYIASKEFPKQLIF